MQAEDIESVPLGAGAGGRPAGRFVGRAVAGVTLSAFLVLVWYFTGGGFFWPVLPLAGLGVAIVVRAVVELGEYSELKIRRAMEDIGSV